jgi:ComF family protein
MRCALPIHHGQVCGACLKVAPAFDHAWSLYRYEDDLRRSISQFKYQQRHYLAAWFADEMAKKLSQRDTLPNCLIPIPLHPFKLRQRGYNQAGLLAHYLGKRLSIKVDKNSLKRIRHTHSQSQLNFKQRKRNIQGAFDLNNHSLAKHVALIDDVMTSGNTATEATKTLRRSQVSTIEVWTIARAISHY